MLTRILLFVIATTLCVLYIPIYDDALVGSRRAIKYYPLVTALMGNICILFGSELNDLIRKVRLDVLHQADVPETSHRLIGVVLGLLLWFLVLGLML